MNRPEGESEIAGSEVTASETAGSEIAASLAGWLDTVTFTDLDAGAVTAVLIDSVVAWAEGQGWRVYRRAPSVVPLPAPYDHRRSCVDVGCARPQGPPIVVEIDHSDRQRTVDKLLAEAGAGRVALWVRWGDGDLKPPPPPAHLVACQVSTRSGTRGRKRLYSHPPAGDRPAPQHTLVEAGTCQQTTLFLPDRTPDESDESPTPHVDPVTQK